MSSEIKYPKKGGVEKAKEAMRELLHRKPSEELIRVINENNRLIDEEDRQESEKSEKQDRAARENPRQPEV